MGQVSKVDAGENLDAEIGSDASNLNRGTVLGLGCDGGTKEGEVFRWSWERPPLKIFVICSVSTV